MLRGVPDFLAELIEADVRRARARLAQVDDAAGIKRLRRSTGLTQRTFARRLGISIETLRNWEQGKRRVRGPARVLLRLVARDPSVLAPGE